MTINPAPLAKLAEVSPPPRPEGEVDDFDLALLRALAADARQSQRALARQIEMSPPAVADRLARLERSGVIRGYRADIDWAAREQLVPVVVPGPAILVASIKALLPDHCGHRLDFPPRWKLTLDIEILQL